MTDILVRRLGVGVAAVLGTDAAIHLVWATGVRWPAADERELSFAVLNADVPFTPRVLIPLAVLLIIAAATVAVRSRGLGRLAQAGTVAVAVGFAARGAAGLVWATGLGVDHPGPFLWLNRLLYTPLCLALCAASWAIARRGRSRS